MGTCRITVAKICIHKDLIEKYELPQTDACFMKENDIFYSHSGEKPDGFCDVAWNILKPYIDRLENGETTIYGDWMKNPSSVMISCDDGFRPVSFYVKKIK